MEIKMSPQEMKTPLERVCDEKDDLYIKIINLSKMLCRKDVISIVGYEQYKLLQKQFIIMNEYYRILCNRIVIWE